MATHRPDGTGADGDEEDENMERSAAEPQPNTAALSSQHSAVSGQPKFRLPMHLRVSNQNSSQKNKKLRISSIENLVMFGGSQAVCRSPNGLGLEERIVL